MAKDFNTLPPGPNNDEIRYRRAVERVAIRTGVDFATAEDLRKLAIQGTLGELAGVPEAERAHSPLLGELEFLDWKASPLELRADEENGEIAPAGVRPFLTLIRGEVVD